MNACQPAIYVKKPFFPHKTSAVECGVFGVALGFGFGFAFRMRGLTLNSAINDNGSIEILAHPQDRLPLLLGQGGELLVRGGFGYAGEGNELAGDVGLGAWLNSAVAVDDDDGDGY